jgi:hypothetical protein
MYADPGSRIALGDDVDRGSLWAWRIKSGGGRLAARYSAAADARGEPRPFGLKSHAARHTLLTHDMSRQFF